MPRRSIDTASLYFVDMVETLGELAGTIKVKEFCSKKPEFYEAKPKADLEHKIVDFFYDISMIANIFGVDLARAFSLA